jgi:hypothetical protein
MVLVRHFLSLGLSYRCSNMGEEQGGFPSANEEQGVKSKGKGARGRKALLLRRVSQSRAHWLRFYADAKVVAGFSPHHHLHKKPLPQAHHLPPQSTKAAARGLPATAASKGLEQGVGLAFSRVSQPRTHWSRFFAD